MVCVCSGTQLRGTFIGADMESSGKGERSQKVQRFVFVYNVFTTAVLTVTLRVSVAQESL